MNPTWYFRRLRRMSASEIAGRVIDQGYRVAWRVRPPDVASVARKQLVAGAKVPRLKALPPPATLASDAKRRLLERADQLLDGKWKVFAQDHGALGKHPDWFVDARSGKHAASDVYAFDIPYRDEERIGNIKYIWEPSRHHHLTLLAAAYYATGDGRYAERIAEHLRSWWKENQFPYGPHWISGIELGIRLISWAWIRQLLVSWPAAEDLFEQNDAFLEQLYAHQLWLSRFPSRGSSANNHVIAEAAGTFIAACVFPFFKESEVWRKDSAKTLRTQAAAQTFACGANRELATEYHGFVLELLLAAAVQGEAAGQSLGEPVWDVICRMTDVVAAMLDDGTAPRQGDGDEGIGLLLDDPDNNRWTGLLATGARLFSAQPWWPKMQQTDLRTFFLAEKVNAPPTARPVRKPKLLPDAGQIFLTSEQDALWCRCDHGPHGFGSIAAHAHADALSIELRLAGVEIFADPGTFCYHGDPKWRAYFRSTFAHNTLCLFGRDQSASGGPFLWTRHATSQLIAVSGLDDVEAEASWSAKHAGYSDNGGPLHRRSVRLLRASRKLVITDDLLGGHGKPVPASLSWHLGPSVKCGLDGRTAFLSWVGGRAELHLPGGLQWTSYHGDEVVPAGWYSPSFDRKVPATTLVGSGVMAPGTSLVTELDWFVTSLK